MQNSSLFKPSYIEAFSVNEKNMQGCQDSRQNVKIERGKEKETPLNLENILLYV